MYYLNHESEKYHNIQINKIKKCSFVKAYKSKMACCTKIKIFIYKLFSRDGFQLHILKKVYIFIICQ